LCCLAKMVYHSSFVDGQDYRYVGNLPILPLKTKYKGPAPQCAPDQTDIVDEAISLFKANILFRNFEVKGGGDRLLIYLTLYISKCLLKFAEKKPNKGDAEKLLYQTAIENFSLPGDKDFPLGGLVTPPKDRAETDLLRQYFLQLRQEIGLRLVGVVYTEPSKPSKWWMCFSKRKFLNKAV